MPEFQLSFSLSNYHSHIHRCVAIDMRGYGDSEKPTDPSKYALELLVSDIREILRSLNRETFTLVCHDWGAIIGWRYVQQHMDTIERYVMIGAPSLEVYGLAAKQPDQFRKGWYVHFFQTPYIPEIAIRANDMRLFDEIRSTHVDDRDLEAYKYMFGRPDALTAPLNYYRFNFMRRCDKPIRPTEYKPGLFLLGQHEKYISLETGPLSEELYPNLRYRVVPNANHFAQQNTPSTVNSLMRQFLMDQQ